MTLLPTLTPGWFFTMTIALILFCFLIAYLFARLNWRLIGRAIFAISLLSGVLIGYGFPTNFLLDTLQAGYGTSTHQWGSKNLIILLGAGSEVNDRNAIEPGWFGYARINKTAELYRDCQQTAHECRVLITGGDPQRHGKSEAEVYGISLIRLGVTDSDIQLETKSNNTWQNAQFSAALIGHDAYDQQVLVTSGTHLRRSAVYFSHFGIKPILIRSDYVQTHAILIPTASNFMLMDLVLHEYLGIWRYHVYNVLGWNVVATAPGSL